MDERKHSVPKIVEVERNAKRRREMSKLEEDLISKLPDSILCSFISMLSMREAVRTSILSSRWRHFWKSIPNQIFDAADLFGTRSPWRGKFSWSTTEEEKKLQTCEFSIPEGLPTYTDLVMILSPNLYGDLLWIASLLEACPVLEKLHVDFCTPYLLIDDPREVRRPSKYPHYHLKEVEMSGFAGSTNQMEFATYVLNNAIGLESMIIEPYFKQYVGDGKWKVCTVDGDFDWPWYRIKGPKIMQQLC